MALYVFCVMVMATYSLLSSIHEELLVCCYLAGTIQQIFVRACLAGSGFYEGLAN